MHDTRTPLPPPAPETQLAPPLPQRARPSGRSLVAIGVTLVAAAALLVVALTLPRSRSGLATGAPGSAARFGVDLTRAETEWDFVRFVQMASPALGKAQRANAAESLRALAASDGTEPPVYGATYQWLGTEDRHPSQMVVVRVVAPTGEVSTWHWLLTMIGGHWSILDYEKTPG